MDKSLQAGFARRGHRRAAAAAGRCKRLSAPTIMVFACLALASCTPFANYVSDKWPTWAGGMPKDVPPRPGEPGYEEFIAHRQGGEGPAPAIATAPAPTPVAATAAAGTTAIPPATNANAPPLSPRVPQANAPVTVQGGLY
jgi:hypothetical protein